MVLKNIERIFKDRRAKVMGIEDKYGITLPLIEREGRLELIYQVRASSLRRQPGEVSFPGGRVEVGESFKEGAIRECMEELCLGRESIVYIGELDRLVTDYQALVHSFLVLIEGIDFEDLRPNRAEVESLFTVPLDYLLESDPKVYDLELEVKNSRDFPYELIPNGRAYKWDRRNEGVYFYSYQDHTIWGLTARLTRNFIEVYRGEA